jgi:hypothetical protein
MSEIAFCSVAFGERYVWRMGRLKESILNIYPDASLFFHKDSLPPGSRTFQESMYGFKPHSIQEALNAGFKKIVWIDSTMILHDRLEYYDQFTEEHGVLAVQDDNKLTGFCSNRALKYINKYRSYLEDKHLVGGSFFYFDFNVPLCQHIFNRWIEAEMKGLFGSVAEECSERLQGHRHDETMMALFLYEHGSKPFTGYTRYNYEKDSVLTKSHFK